MRNIPDIIENTLNNVSRSTSLWSMKTAYKLTSKTNRLEARNIAALRIDELKKDLDFELAGLWIEFLTWTTTYENRL